MKAIRIHEPAGISGLVRLSLGQRLAGGLAGADRAQARLAGEAPARETMLRAWRASAGFDGRSSVRAWLYRIAADTCLDLMRGRERRGWLGRRLQASAEVSTATESSADPAGLAASQDGVRLALAAPSGRTWR